MTTHMPVRPHWRCINCERPWPCDEYKLDALSTPRTDSLTREMRTFLDPMAEDLIGPGVADAVLGQVLHERLLGWTRDQPMIGPPKGFARRSF